MSDLVELQQDISIALQLITEARKQVSQDFFDAIEDELNRIKSSVEKFWPLSAYETKKLWLGPYAIRNLQDIYPELSKILVSIHYLCKKHLE